MGAKRLIGLSVFIIVAIVAGHGIFGFVEVWHDTSDWYPANSRHFKPQEKPGYVPMPTTSVMTNGGYYAKNYANVSAVIEPDVTTRDRAALLKNPIPPTNESLQKGKQLFDNYCARCHGWEGEGQGLMGSVPVLRKESEQENQELSDYLSGYLGYRPNVNLNYFNEQEEGYIFFTITTGGEAIMPSYKDALSVEDRWHVINYIKNVLGGKVDL